MLIKTLKMGAFALILLSWAGEAQAREYCREYQKTIYVGGKAVEGYGTACRQEDGAWEISKLKGSDRAQTKVREYIVDDLNRQGAREIIVVNEPRYYNPPPVVVVRDYSGYPRGYSKYHHNKNFYWTHNGRDARHYYKNKHVKKHSKKSSHKNYSHHNNYKSKDGLSITYNTRW